jgi:two-component system response regulator PilR (NtrC family)
VEVVINTNRDKPTASTQTTNRLAAGEPGRASDQSFRKNYREHGSEVEPIEVVGWEWSDARWETIADACAACGARAHRLTGLEQVRSVSKAERFAAALVALHEQPENSSPCLSAISHFKGLGLKVIAYEKGLDSWPVGARCRALLAGSKYLLDSADGKFRQILRTTLSDLLAALREQRGEEDTIRDLARSHGIIGESESLLESFRQLVRASKLSDLPVLITGESGTGKELFASALHALDPKRCRHSFIPVNCAAINAGVAESELFGHVKGAFTGAGHDHSGYLLAAQGGVLFLDEIGELSLELQAKMLRVLQEKRLFRVGGAQEMAVDIRVVVATNRDLPTMVRAERFREDLFHRLNSLSIRITPLRERRVDLRLLVEHLVSLHGPRCEHPGIRSDLIDALARLELSGNVRELGNIIIAALAGKTDSSPLSLKDLPPHVWAELSATDPPTGEACAPAATEKAAGLPSTASRIDSLALRFTEQGWNLDRCLAHCEQEIIKASLQYTKNNQSRAARLLGITPRSMYNKLRKYELARKSD